MANRCTSQSWSRSVAQDAANLVLVCSLSRARSKRKDCKFENCGFCVSLLWCLYVASTVFSAPINLGRSCCLGFAGMAPKQTEELFVKQAEVYKRARPRCPEELYAFVASLTPSHELAWDVGTGNGQAAAAISKHFQKVVATDVAEEQLKYAEQRPNITYAVTPSTLSKEELTRIVGPEGSVDLVLIVEALHWFDFDKFYNDVKHVLRKPGGVIAATVYPSRPKVEASVDKVTDEFYATIQHHWAPRMLEYVETGYRTIPFPFAPAVEENGCPQFEATVDANLDQFLAYLESWSAVQTAIDHGEEPLGAHQRKLFADAWGPPETVRCLKWPLDVLLGTA